MKKYVEIRNTSSCLNRAGLDELIFVLLSRDAAAPATIRFWCAERMRLGKNKSDDLQIIEALATAKMMEAEGLARAKLTRLAGDWA
jgi:hypothetical protein